MDTGKEIHSGGYFEVYRVQMSWLPQDRDPGTEGSEQGT